MPRTYIFLLSIGCSLLCSWTQLKKPSHADLYEIRAIHGSDTVHFDNARIVRPLKGNALAVYRQDTLYILTNNTLTASFPVASVTCFSLDADTLFVGTSHGLYAIAIRAPRNLLPIAMPARDPDAPITGLAVDAKKTLWITTNGYGMFSRTAGTFRPYATAPNMTCVETTVDGSVWAGSNIGLFHLRPDGELKRYYEEISAVGIAIPDNIVERIQTDAANNLWIFMSQATSVLRPDEYSHTRMDRSADDIDPHSYGFIGDKANHIRRLLGSEGDSLNTWVLADDGLYDLKHVVLTNEPELSTPDEIAPPKGNAKRVTEFHGKHSRLQFDVPLDAQFDVNGSLLLATTHGLYRIPKTSLE